MKRKPLLQKKTDNLPSEMNTYNLKARVYPMIISLIPIVIIGFIYSINLQSGYEVLTSLGITTALYFLFSQIGRDNGKSIEKEMWKKWNGAPTTQVLRYCDNTINKHTKLRYHDKLKTLTGIGETVTEKFESDYSDEADEVYKAWTAYLISNTRNTKKYNLLFQENVNYGFRRNLFGLKRFALTINVVLMIVCFAYSFFIESNKISFSKELIISEIILALIIFFWFTIVREKWIKVIAFSYAERLIETTEIQ